MPSSVSRVQRPRLIAFRPVEHASCVMGDSVRDELIVRQTTPADFAAIIDTCRLVYDGSPAWTETQLASHLEVFPRGQLVAIRPDTGRLVGMAASLIVFWDDYDFATSWRDFTNAGDFTNHNIEQGRTLYGAEVMVAPSEQGRGVGSALYAARRDLVEELGLLRIRAGARLRGYRRVAALMSPADYVERVVRRELRDPTLSFQIARGFAVLEVVSGYLRHDPESGGHAAVIEWLNRRVAKPEDFGHGNPRFGSVADA